MQDLISKILAAIATLALKATMLAMVLTNG